MGEMGFLGVTVAESMGGLGLGYLEHTVAMEGELRTIRLSDRKSKGIYRADEIELSRASASISLSYGVSYADFIDGWVKVLMGLGSFKFDGQSA